MTDRTPAELAAALEARAEYWEGKCNRLNYGACQTVGCLKRGGWKRGAPVEYEVATCETYEACNTDRAAAAKLREMELALMPFARAADIKLCATWGDDQRIHTTDTAWHIKFGDLRAARAALSQARGDG